MATAFDLEERIASKVWADEVMEQKERMQRECQAAELMARLQREIEEKNASTTTETIS